MGRYQIITAEDKVHLHVSTDRKIKVTVKGQGELQGLGSGNPISEENFFDGAYTAFYGKALAVIRPIGIGSIKVKIEADKCEPILVELEAIE